jgi:excisionase family DNA binding protein
MAEPERLLTVADVAATLRCSRNTAYQYIASGSIPCVRLGHSIRVRPEALRTWLVDQETSQTGSALSLPPGGLHVGRRSA